MNVRILGCSGGIGGRHLRTTSMMVDRDILIDCGTGVSDLSIEDLAQIDHVFLTHTHLDHIACLPLIIDAVGDMRDRPMVVRATPEVLHILRTHVFNWLVWPDFSEIPSPDAPSLRFETISIGEPVVIGNRSITALPADHTVPAVGYVIDSGRASLAFSGDTGVCPEQWQAINKLKNLRYLIYECAFPNRDRELALASKHLCPSMLANELKRLECEVELFITHLKPSQIETTMREIEDSIRHLQPRMLQNNQVFEL